MQIIYQMMYCEYIPVGITAANVAPEFSAAETEAYLELAEFEFKALGGTENHNACPSNFQNVLEKRW